MVNCNDTHKLGPQHLRTVERAHPSPSSLLGTGRAVMMITRSASLTTALLSMKRARDWPATMLLSIVMVPSTTGRILRAAP